MENAYTSTLTTTHLPINRFVKVRPFSTNRFYKVSMCDCNPHPYQKDLHRLRPSPLLSSTLDLPSTSSDDYDGLVLLTLLYSYSSVGDQRRDNLSTESFVV